MWLGYVLLAVAYLLGSIPFSIVLGKAIKGIDIRLHGSGNPGGTNSLRFLGRHIGLWVLFLDGLKAGLIVLLIQWNVIPQDMVFHPLAYGVAAAFGHVYSIFLHFKGGKAVASTVGMMIGYNILYALIMFSVFMIVLKIWRYVSVSSTASVFTGLLIGLVVGFTGTDLRFTGFADGGWQMAICLGLLFLLVVYRHKTNFQNIRNGVEPKTKWLQKKSSIS